MYTLEGVREELFQTIEGLSEEQINHVAIEGQWTIGQVLEHLYLLESSIVNYAQKVLQDQEELPTARKPIETTLDRTRKINTPAPFVPSSESKNSGELVDKLRTLRSSMRSVFGSVDEQTRTKKSIPHPVFGLLDLNQWYEFVALHEKRHLEQIKDIKAALKES